MATPDAAHAYANFALALEYTHIPPDVIACTKKLILDQLGVMLVGASAAGVQELAASVRRSGGAPEASVLGYGFNAPAAQAAMVNGAMARAQDYDALHERGIVHITAGSLPQCLALSEYRGGVTGKEFITAMTAGMEFMIRLGLSFKTSFHDNQYDADVLTRDLGTKFELPDVSIKFYPCCFLSHFAIDAVLQLVREEGLRAHDAEAILVRVTQGTYNVVCSPAEAKRTPTTMEAALFSLQYCVAAALVQGEFGLPQMTLQSIQNPAIQAVAQHVTTTVDAELERQHGVGVGPSIVEVKLKRGGTLTRRVDYCKGHPKNPMQFDDCAEKFRRCAAFAAKPLSVQTVEAVIDAVAHMEALHDVTRIVSLLG